MFKFLIPATALVRKERAMHTAAGGNTVTAASARRYGRIMGTVKGLMPLAQTTDRNAAMFKFVLSMQALREHHSSRS